MAMTDRERFKVAFLEKYAEAGQTPDEAHAGVRYLLAEKSAGIGAALASKLMSLGGTGLTLAAVGGISAPVIGGGLAGYSLAKATDDETSPEEAKADEIIAEYSRLADQAKYRKLLKTPTPAPLHL